MIGYLKGEVLECADGRALLAVGSPDGSSAVGYSVAVPQSAAYLAVLPGKRAEFFIHTHVREDAFDLYGFATRAEKDLFLTLLTVNGIGPKVAMGVLSNAEPEALIQAILDGDRSFLTKIPGIGKKTVERVVLELADPLRKKVESGAISLKRAARTAPARAGAAAPAGATSAVHDARDALVGLGYREADVSALLNRMAAETPAPRAEELVRTALKQLG